jgi:hypothetical protein
MGRPNVSTNGGRGKELPRDEAAIPFGKEPRNRRERRAMQAWRRKQAKKGRSS